MLRKVQLCQNLTATLAFIYSFSSLHGNISMLLSHRHVFKMSRTDVTLTVVSKYLQLLQTSAHMTGMRRGLFASFLYVCM